MLKYDIKLCICKSSITEYLSLYLVVVVVAAIGKLYGRGATDDKGPVLAWLNTLEAYQQTKQVFCLVHSAQLSCVV